MSPHRPHPPWSRWHLVRWCCVPSILAMWHSTKHRRKLHPTHTLPAKVREPVDSDLHGLDVRYNLGSPAWKLLYAKLLQDNDRFFYNIHITQRTKPLNCYIVNISLKSFCLFQQEKHVYGKSERQSLFLGFSLSLQPLTFLPFSFWFLLSWAWLTFIYSCGKNLKLRMK